MITAIIETCDDELRLAYALVALVPAAIAGVIREVVVIDHGSSDGTLAVADAAGCAILDACAVAGDARHVAAREARSDWLMFLSPSSMLQPDWQDEALAFIDSALVNGTARSRAATFRLKHSGRGLRARSGEWLASLRTRLLAAPTPEQGLIIARAFYITLGGHRQLATMADVDLARRVGHWRLTLLRARVVVRDDDTRRTGVIAGIRNVVCLALIAVRVPGRVIGRLAP
jgi:glycosyltransferase involved in cell wall biosynthesis